LDIVKWTIISITGVPEIEADRKEETLFKEIMVENFPNLEKEMIIQT
jgi:hypothetical protein